MIQHCSCTSVINLSLPSGVEIFKHRPCVFFYAFNKMDVITETSLEALLQRATDCRNKETDEAAIDAFCGIIKKESIGPAIASRLIASKIHSVEEREALQGLTVLDKCMSHCGAPFQSEIGKFKFLNEMIKLVSPKFSGLRTPETVKNQVAKMLHDWTLSYPKEYKIKEAYDMLIKQGVIVKQDLLPKTDRESFGSRKAQREMTLFQDEEKVRQLQKLLQSKNPNDFQTANRLIKAMVKEGEKRIEIKSKRFNEVEHTRNNVRLLSEMLESYSPHQSSLEELELINELYESCQRLRSNIISLTSDTQESDLLCHILTVKDELNQILEKYENTIKEGSKRQDSSPVRFKAKESSALLDLSSPIDNFPATSFRNDDLESLMDSSKWCMEKCNSASEKSQVNLCSIDAAFSSLNIETSAAGADHSFPEACSSNESTEFDNGVMTEKKSKAFNELDILGKALLQQYKASAGHSKEDNAQSTSINPKTDDLKPSDNINIKDLMMLPVSEEEKSTSSSAFRGEQSSFSNENIQSLIDVFVSLDTIKPSSLPPIKVIEDKNGISVTIYLAKDAPKKDVTVFVVTTLNKNPHPLSNYLFQAVVPKDCKLKLQPPSGFDLPAHNPFLPPSAISQIMLIANPHNVNVTLKCMISYTVNRETYTEMGEVEKLIFTN